MDDENIEVEFLEEECVEVDYLDAEENKEN